MLKNSLLVVASITITLLVCAVLFEIVAGYRYDAWKAEFIENDGLYGTLTVASDNDVLVWEYRPNGISDTWGPLIETNSDGFRDRDWAREKQDGDLRIAFAGDSVTLGVGIEAAETFVPIFEREARSRAPSANVEAMSFAVHGYSVVQVAELLREKTVPFAPDIAVYVMCMNDFDFKWASGQVMKFFRKPENFTLRFLERVYAKFISDNYFEYHFGNNKDVLFAEILRVKAEMDERGIDFRVAIMPVLEDYDAVSQYPILDIHNEVVATLTENDIPVIDLLPAFDVSDTPVSSYAFDGIHLTELGHQVAASYLVDEILDDDTGRQ